PRSRRHVAGSRTGRNLQKFDVPRHRCHVLARHRGPSSAPPPARTGRGNELFTAPLPRPRAQLWIDPGAARRAADVMKRDSRNAVAPAGLKSWTTGVKLVFAVAVAFSAACGRRTIATPPSN